jgi:hypothetical protein
MMSLGLNEYVEVIPWCRRRAEPRDLQQMNHRKGAQLGFTKNAVEILSVQFKKLLSAAQIAYEWL